MSLLHAEDLISIVRGAKSPCVSIYVPMHRSGSELVQVPIRLDNLLKTAAQQLAEAGHDARTIDAVLAPARELRRDADAWPSPGDGLAILASLAGTSVYRVPLAFPELCVVADRLHIKPLLPLLAGNGRFFVLALSQNSVRLFEGSRDGLRALEARDVPASLSEVVGYDVEQKSLQFRTAGPGAPTGRRAGALFHGHGAGADDQKDEIAKFLRAVDEGVRGIVRDRTGPIVLAAAEPVSSMYRKLSKLPDLLPDGPNGNFEHDDSRTLFEKAWPMVAPRFDAARERTTARIREGLGTGKAVQRIEEVVIAAREGRVDAMLAAVDTARWGRADSAIERHATRQPGDIDLVDVAAAECLLHGGTVHAVPYDEVPGDDNVVAAVLRF